MKSETKLFNKKLYLTNIKRLWPLWALATIGCLMISISGWIDLADRYYRYPENLNVYVARSTCYSSISVSLPLIAFMLAGVIGIGVWSFLCSRSGVDFMHSLPIGRKTIFFTNTLSLYTMVVIPFIPAVLIYGIGSARYGVFVGVTVILQVLGVVLSECLVFTALDIFASVIGGTIVAQVALYMLSNFIFYLAYSTAFSFGKRFLYGVTEFKESTLMNFLSPIIFMLEKVTDSVKYEDTMVYCKLLGTQYLIIYALASIILLFVTYYIYSIRRSESAMEFVAFKSIKVLLLYVCAIVATINFAIVLYSVFNVNYTENVSLIPMIFCVITGTIICFFVALMIVNRTIKVFDVKNIVRCVVLTAVMVVATIITSLDIPGIETKIPATDEISHLILNTGSDRLYITSDNKELMELAKKMQAEIIEEGERSGREWDGGYSINLSYTYYLKSGEYINRNYYIPLNGDNMENDESLERKLNDFLNSPIVYKNKCYIGADQAKYSYSYISGCLEDGTGINEDVPYDKLDELKAAIEADYEAGDYAVTDLFFDYSYDFLCIDIEIEDFRGETVNMENLDMETYEVASDYCIRLSIYYNPSMKNLTNFLLDNHLADDYLLRDK